MHCSSQELVDFLEEGLGIKEEGKTAGSSSSKASTNASSSSSVKGTTARTTQGNGSNGSSPSSPSSSSSKPKYTDYSSADWFKQYEDVFDDVIPKETANPKAR